MNSHEIYVNEKSVVSSLFYITLFIQTDASLYNKLCDLMVSMFSVFNLEFIRHRTFFAFNLYFCFARFSYHHFSVVSIFISFIFIFILLLLLFFFFFLFLSSTRCHRFICGEDYVVRTRRQQPIQKDQKNNELWQRKVSDLLSVRCICDKAAVMRVTSSSCVCRQAFYFKSMCVKKFFFSTQNAEKTKKKNTHTNNLTTSSLF